MPTNLYPSTQGLADAADFGTNSVPSAFYNRTPTPIPARAPANTPLSPPRSNIPPPARPAPARAIGGITPRAGNALGAALGALSIPANYRRGYEQAGRLSPGDSAWATFNRRLGGATESLEGLIPSASITGAIADWLVDGITDQFSPTPAPQRDGPREPYQTPGQASFEGGQGIGVAYEVSYEIRATNSFGRRFDVDAWTSSFSTYYGPIESVILQPGRFKNFGIRDSRGAEVILLLNIDALNIESYRPVFRRIDGQPDTGGNPASTPVPALPGTLQPQELPARPTPQAPTMPSPQRAPATLPETLIGLGVAGGLGLAGVAAFRRGVRPATQPQPYQPPTPNAPRTRANNRCPCSTPIPQPGAQPSAETAVILARLQQMQTFAETAWASTRLNKLINLLTLISILHNSAMLSADVLQTIGDLASNMLATVGIKDENGSALDINELVGSSVSSFLEAVFGAEVVNNTSEAWLKANRIIRSASQIVYTVRSINDASKDILEWGAENIGKIGNALKRYGVVGERSYPWMAERVKAQDVYRRRFQRVTEGLENLEDTASSLGVVTSNVREIQEEFTELGEQRQAFTNLVSEVSPVGTPTSAPENEPILEAENFINQSSESSDVAIADAQRGST